MRGEALRGASDVDWAALPKLRLRTRSTRLDEYTGLDADGNGQGDLALQVKAGFEEGILLLFGGEHLEREGEISVDDAFLDGGRRGDAVSGLPYAQEYPSLGYALTSAGDLDGDGAEELLAGSPLARGDRGEAHVISFKPGLVPPPDSARARDWAGSFGITPARVLDPAAPERDVFSARGTIANESVGYTVAGAGDLNGEGAPDLALGSVLRFTPECPVCSRGPWAGLPYAYVLFGGAHLLAGETHPLAREGFEGGLLIQGAGNLLAGGRDVNGDGFSDLATARDFSSVYLLFGGPELGEVRFKRGDVDLNGTLDLSDAVRLLGYLFLGEGRPRCLAALDVDDDGELVIADAISLLSFLFLGGDPPRAPFPEPGKDPTPDGLGCEGR